jgi:Golgi nucleoside diphosphatase
MTSVVLLSIFLLAWSLCTPLSAKASAVGGGGGGGGGGVCEDGVGYAIVVDAGSTGSRGYVVQVGAPAGGEGAPEFDIVPGIKVKPGLSTFFNDLEGLSSYLHPLLLAAASAIPDACLAQAELHVRGTGGMRLLAPEVQEAVWAGLYAQLAVRGYPFSVQRANMDTISGECA